MKTQKARRSTVRTRVACGLEKITRQIQAMPAQVDNNRELWMVLVLVIAMTMTGRRRRPRSAPGVGARERRAWHRPIRVVVGRRARRVGAAAARRDAATTGLRKRVLNTRFIVPDVLFLSGPRLFSRDATLYRKLAIM